MKKTIAGICLALILALCCPASLAEDADPVRFFLQESLYAGVRVIRLQVEEEGLEGLRVNAFADGVQIGASAEKNEKLVTLSLTRPMRAQEEIKLVLDRWNGNIASGAVTASFPVTNRFGGKLPALEARANEIWNVWKGKWMPAFLEGKVYILNSFANNPFATYPDEAPEMIVEETGETARIYLSEPLPEGWQLSLATGLPVTLTPCAYDEAADVYTGPAGFDSVYLVRPQGEEQVSVTIIYQRTDAFRAGYPIIQWVESEEEDAIAFNCYGFGTTRRWNGGMYAIVGRGSAWYAEYDHDGDLAQYYDMITGCAYDGNGTLLAGDEPEGYVNPVLVW